MHPVERNTLDTLYDLLHEMDPEKRGWCIDGGAGIQDFFGLYFHEWGWQSLIVEPKPSAALLSSLTNHIMLEAAALCAIDGMVTLYEGHDGNTHSLDAQWENVTGHPHANIETQVPGIRYKSLLEKWGMERITCMKLDIEGSEWDVIRQFLEGEITLPQIVSIEYGGGFAKSSGMGGWAEPRFTNVLKCIDVLRACGYTHGAHCEETITEFTFAQHPRGIWREAAGYGNLVVWQT
jgi:FkbM family methyltransferase